MAYGHGGTEGRDPGRVSPDYRRSATPTGSGVPAGTTTRPRVGSEGEAATPATAGTDGDTGGTPRNWEGEPGGAPDGGERGAGVRDYGGARDAKPRCSPGRAGMVEDGTGSNVGYRDRGARMSSGTGYRGSPRGAARDEPG